MVSTNKGRKVYVSAAANPIDINQAAFELLTWVQITGVSNLGEMTSAANILSLPLLETEVLQKGKGIVDAGDPEVSVARESTDAGQILLRTLADANTYHAFKFEHADNLGGTSNTIDYSRGLVTGPAKAGGGPEDFDIEVFTFALVQKILTVELVA